MQRGEGRSLKGKAPEGPRALSPVDFFRARKTAKGFFPSVIVNRERKGGRPRHYPTEMQRRLVRVLAAHGIAQREISRALAIDPKTLRLHYRRELDVGAVKLEAALVLHLYRLASGNGPVALKALVFLLRSRFGWSKFAPVAVARG